jgi:hypothetical protein
MDVVNGTCWSCKLQLGNGGCTDNRHKRIYKMLRNNGHIRVIARVSIQLPANNQCSEHFPVDNFSGQTFVTAQRVLIPGIIGESLKRNTTK